MMIPEGSHVLMLGWDGRKGNGICGSFVFGGVCPPVISVPLGPVLR